MTKQVDIELATPLRHGQRLDRCVDGDAGVVHQGAERAVLRITGDTIGDRRDVVVHGDVEDPGFDACLPQRLGVAVASDPRQDVETLPGQPASGGGTDPG